uniref:G protein-coupled receptor n=1 Tax=Steinernema glaseri TaxID=37863 RepID=A0A1I8AUI1_9BILA
MFSSIKRLPYSLVWIILTDLLLELFFLPLPLMEVLAFCPTGMGKWLGPNIMYTSLVAIAFCFGEYLTSLQLAFFYRYWSLRGHFAVCGRQITRRHYIVGIIALMVVPAGSMAIGTIFARADNEELHRRIVEFHPELTPFLGIGRCLAFDKGGYAILFAVITLVILMWVFFVIWCIHGIVTHFKEHSASLSEHTYKLHVQLFKALAIQATAPLILFAIPLALSVSGMAFGLSIMNGNALLRTTFTVRFRCDQDDADRSESPLYRQLADSGALHQALQEDTEGRDTEDLWTLPKRFSFTI